MKRLASTFASLRARNRKGLIVYLTAGDPTLGDTPGLVVEAARAGADVVEIGVPFSDPTADGPVIQAAMQRALASGVRLAGILEAVKLVRCESEVPIVLFSYLNPILQYGPRRFARDAADAGADGLLIVDLPVDESDDLVSLSKEVGLDYVVLVAPTSPEPRVKQAAAAASGFVYAIARTGITGAGQPETEALSKMLKLVRRHTSLPIAVGFGVHAPLAAKEIAELGDAVVVGSALVQAVAQAHAGEHRKALAEAVLSFRRAID